MFTFPNIKKWKITIPPLKNDSVDEMFKENQYILITLPCRSSLSNYGRRRRPILPS